MKALDLRAKTEDELKDELLSLRKEKFNLRFQQANGQLENTARMNTIRRDIARVKTVLNEKQNGVEIVTASKAEAKSKKAVAKKSTSKASAKKKD